MNPRLIGFQQGHVAIYIHLSLFDSGLSISTGVEDQQAITSKSGFKKA